MRSVITKWEDTVDFFRGSINNPALTTSSLYILSQLEKVRDGKSAKGVEKDFKERREEKINHGSLGTVSLYNEAIKDLEKMNNIDPVKDMIKQNGSHYTSEEKEEKVKAQLCKTKTAISEGKNIEEELAKLEIFIGMYKGDIGSTYEKKKKFLREHTYKYSGRRE